MSRSALSARKRKGRDTYHHGELRAELIVATEAILSERGVEGFTLREAARRAGVSPAAPAHHFGDAAGLLTEVATLGFAELGRMLEEADSKNGPDPRRRLAAQGRAYVRFALENRARFQLMFRTAMLDPAHGQFAPTAERAFTVLADAVRDLVGIARSDPLTPDATGKALALWSVVHGFAHLALDGQMERTAARIGSEKAIMALLPSVLAQLEWAMPG